MLESCKNAHHHFSEPKAMYTKLPFGGFENIPKLWHFALMGDNWTSLSNHTSELLTALVQVSQSTKKAISMFQLCH